MKIRYYLRGLGLGVLVTSIFFMLSNNSSQTMSDEMIKERARELGMTESTVLAELTVEEETILDIVEEVTETTIIEEATTEEISIEETVEETTVVETVSEEAVEETTVEETVTEESVSEEAIEETRTEEVAEQEGNASGTETQGSIVGNVQTVSIPVNSGDGSDTVSSRLQKAGLVADAYEFDRYLIANGYDKKIRVGEHSIPTDATWEEMAKILCNM